MKRLFKKTLLITLAAGATLASAACAIKSENVQKYEDIYDATFQKEIRHVTKYENIPSDYKFMNWKERALGYDNFVFDYNSNVHEYLPLIWDDQTYNTFGIAAYVGDDRHGVDGAQEAVTNIAAVLSATLVGIDKSDQYNKNFVNQLLAFYSEEEQVVLNNPAGSSETTSMWYMIYPAMLFAQVSSLYEDETRIKDKTLLTIDSWYKAYEIMWNNGNPDFSYTGFNFKTMQPYNNNIWSEPDSAVGIGMLMYYGYEMTNDQKYLNAAIDCMDYIESYFLSPMYEVLLYYGPYLAAKLNAEHGKNYNIDELFNEIFGGGGIPRSGWGGITGEWNNLEVNGLMGSITDGGGYAFAMNTFAAAGAVVPTIKYDTRYASSIGKWILNLASNSRFFFPDNTKGENQSCTYIQECSSFIALDDNKVIPYEGIRKTSNGKTPWIGGDPTVYGWANTDLSLYSGSHIGVLASIISKTNVDKILKLDLNATEYYSESYPTYSIYNPYNESKTINYEINSKNDVDLYNAITKEIIATNVSNNFNISIESNDSIVIVELPTSTNIFKQQNSEYANDIFIGTNKVRVQILNVSHNLKISEDFKLSTNIMRNDSSDSIESIKVSIGNESSTYSIDDEILINISNLENKAYKIIIEVTTYSGLTDFDEVRVIIEK